MGVEKLLGEILELSQAWVEATDTQLRADGVLESMLEEWRKKPGLSGGDDIDWEELKGRGRYTKLRRQRGQITMFFYRLTKVYIECLIIITIFY